MPERDCSGVEGGRPAGVGVVEVRDERGWARLRTEKQLGGHVVAHESLSAGIAIGVEVVDSAHDLPVRDTTTVEQAVGRT